MAPRTHKTTTGTLLISVKKEKQFQALKMVLITEFGQNRRNPSHHSPVEDKSPRTSWPNDQKPLTVQGSSTMVSVEVANGSKR